MTDTPEPPVPPPLAGAADPALVRWHLAASLAWLLAGLLAGLWVAACLVWPGLAPGIPWLAPGRQRMVHTTVLGQGFLWNGLVGALYSIVPAAAGRAVLSRRLGVAAFWLWQAVVAAGAAGIAAGGARGVEWAEGPALLDPLVTPLLAATAVNLLAPILAEPRRAAAPPLGYVAAGLAWTVLLDLLGRHGVPAAPPGAAALSLSGLYLHASTGLALAPLGFAILLHGAAEAAGGRLRYGGLARAGMWVFVIAYPLNALDPFLRGVLPGSLPGLSGLLVLVVSFVVLAVVLPVAASLASAP
ncbi:MAG: cbb3-type cytochrome c oxidase subunit I, partial [Planctomycetales bacterium]|nr:cbb3-type cytochrome c oxidase subunit I [Planctomycetales bacterium]